MRALRNVRALRDERGMTLVELTVTMVIIGIIVVGIGSAFTASQKAQDNATARLGESNDLATVSPYFQRDVDSARTYATSGTGSCGGNSALILVWTDEGTGIRYEADYLLSGTELRRILCRSYDGATWRTKADHTIARHVKDLQIQRMPASGTWSGLAVTITTTTDRTYSFAAYRRAPTP